MSDTHGFTPEEWDGMPAEYKTDYESIDREAERAAFQARRTKQARRSKRNKKGKRR